MANLYKHGARSSKISNGYAYFSASWDTSAPSSQTGGFPPVLYGITIGNRNATGAAQFKDEQHKIELTEDQMLQAVHEWMKLFARNRDEERLAREKRNAA